MIGKTRKTSRRSFVAAALLTGLALSQAPAAVAAPAPPVAEVPAPATKTPLGTKTLHLVDTSRRDPWKPAAGNRELMVTLWYPALPSRNSPAPYVSKSLSKAFLGSDALAGVRTHSVTDARPAPRPRPLVVLSPGFGMSRITLTALGEDLASRGYAVAAVDHTYEAPVEFPGGRIEKCEICETRDLAGVARNRSKDLRFVLDRLTAPGSELRVDARHIGIAGHSIGGASAVRTMRDDRRVDAAVNLDGDFFTESPADDTDRPVLLLGAQRGRSAKGSDWQENWEHLTGWKRWLDVADGGHLTFTDVPWIADRFGRPSQIPPEQVPGQLGTVGGVRATALTRGYVAAFFDRQLRGRPSPLLDRPSAAFPEVAFLK
ncbi:alpha/beta hydrolase [Streptomyces sp. ISL-11]|uniref:alpha/beta hydrolase family protein n=1 Tax=Streptomyces sp. ISL-11 TaxID=2819174 RepID=UPI001BEB21AD|nr:alpha/beta hydrolase [Streptomyces sp. ISL-11]MBT2386238.1 alpha/beta hydrolase [Streptomyces sp. ISL-11]